MTPREKTGASLRGLTTAIPNVRCEVVESNVIVVDRGKVWIRATDVNPREDGPAFNTDGSTGKARGDVRTARGNGNLH